MPDKELVLVNTVTHTVSNFLLGRTSKWHFSWSLLLYLPDNIIKEIKCSYILIIKYCLCTQTQNGSGTEYKRAGLVNLTDFHTVVGWLANSQYEANDKIDFNWNDEDLGIINGNIIKLRDILFKSKFKDIRIETKKNYEWRNCNEEFQAPCPYFYTAIASLVAPIFLSVFTLLTIGCCSKCFKQGMFNFGM